MGDRDHPAIGAGDVQEDAGNRLEPVAQRDQQLVGPVGQRGQQTVMVDQRWIELDARRDLGAFPGRDHRPVVQALRPALRRASGGPEAGQYPGRRQARELAQGADAQVPELQQDVGIQRQGWDRLAGQEGALGGGRQQQRGVLPGDLPRHAGAELAAGGAQGRLPAQAAHCAGHGLAPTQQLAIHPGDPGLSVERQAGRVQVDPPQAVRLPTVGVAFDAFQEAFLRLPEREPGRRDNGRFRAARRGLALGESGQHPGLTGSRINRQNPAVFVQQHQGASLQPGIGPPGDRCPKLRHPQVRDLPLRHASLLRP